MLLKSRASPDVLPFSLCNKKRLAIRHMNRPLLPTTLSIPSYDIGKLVGLMTYQHPFVHIVKIEIWTWFEPNQSKPSKHIFILQICSFAGSNPIFLWGHTAYFKGTTAWVLMTDFHLPVLWKINYINYQVYIHVTLSTYHSLISLKFYAASFAFVRIYLNVYHHMSTSFQPTNNLSYLTKPFLEDPPQDTHTFRWYSTVKWRFKHIKGKRVP